MSNALWITEREVVELLDLGEAITALEQGLLAETRGEAANMVKTHLAWGHNNMHAIGAKLNETAGTKTWAHTEGGTCPLLILFDSRTGALKAVIEAFALGQMRTAAISGVATQCLARQDAAVMAVIGSGKQALPQVAAVAAVRPLKRLNVYSPRPASRAQFIGRVRKEFEFEVVDCESAAQACQGAQVLTLVTRATQPVVSAAMLERGIHVNAVGAITPEREEFSQDVFARVSVAAVDSLPSVQKLSREFMNHYGKTGWEQVKPLSALLAAGRRRTPGDDITLFKAMGMGISDLALGVEILARAQSRGIGRAIAQPERAAPRLRTRVTL